MKLFFFTFHFLFFFFLAAAEDTMEKEDSNESEGEGRRYSLLDATGSITSDSEAGADTWVKFSGRTLLRTCLVSVTCCIAIFVPFFGLLMELVGALCLTMMVFVLPVLFSWSLWGEFVAPSIYYVVFFFFFFFF